MSPVHSIAGFGPGLRRFGRRLAAAGAIAASMSGCAGVHGRVSTDPAAAARGEVLAAQACGSCHGLGLAGESNFPRAPAFRAMRLDLDAISYERRMAEFHLGQVKMPPAQISLQDVRDIRAYVVSLQRPISP